MFAHLVSLEIVEDKIHIYICSALRTYHNSGHKKMVTLTQGWKELKFLMSAILYQYPLNKFLKILVSFVLGLVAQSCPTLCDPMDFSLPSSSVHGNSPGKNTGVGCHALLQGIFPTQGSNPRLPHTNKQVPKKICTTYK